MTYAEWIKQHYPTSREALGKCKEASHAMKAAFPELRVTNGFVHGPGFSDAMHWWCVATDGSIVDPTAIQYGGPILHEEIDDSHPARNFSQARCMNCGERYYATPELDGVMHTKACEREFEEYMNGPLKRRVSQR